MATTTLLDSLKRANLLPSKIIPENFTPTIHLTVKYPSGFSPENGALARVSQIKEQPMISITPTSSHPPSHSFTLMQIDPDAPTPDDPKFGYWRHWLVVNIPSSSAAAADSNTGSIVDSGKTLTRYLAPGPQDESGPHRYLFLLFREPAGLELGKSDVGGEEFVDRRSFRAEEFVWRHGLELVGVQWMRGVGDGWNGGKDEI